LEKEQIRTLTMILGDIYEASKEGNKFVGEMIFKSLMGYMSVTVQAQCYQQKTLNPLCTTAQCTINPTSKNVNGN
jgi:hypothetical protein